MYTDRDNEMTADAMTPSVDSSQTTMAVPRITDTMLERLPLETGDGRKFVVVAGIMTLVIAVVIDGTIPVRVISGIIIGAFSGIVFLVTTIVLRTFLTGYYW